VFEKGSRLKFELIFLILLLILPIVVFSQRPRFSEYPISLYKGRFHLPKWARNVQGTEWRDEQNKLVEPPSINFAGKYYVGAHSLGTGVRYYSLTDLSTGRELSLLDSFATTEDSPAFTNGMHYLIILDSRETSRLLRVRFQQTNWGADFGPCHERYFLLTEKKLLSIAAKRYRCIDE